MDRIADFEILRVLGRGGMGIVYLATEKPLGRLVALKVLHPQFASDPDIRARFSREAASIAKLSHDAIIKVHRYGADGHTFFLALEYVEGLPLDQILNQEYLTTRRVVEVVKTVADALWHAHQAGIVHRDIKPGNVFVRKDGKVVLGDFGIARHLDPTSPALTQAGIIIGTPAYMSPEQVRGELVSPASDVYSLGIMAFEMVTGRVPFTANTAVEVCTKHLTEPLPDIAPLAPGLPKSLAHLIERMLEKDPIRRPKNGKEVVDSLAAIEEELDLAERPTEILQPISHPPKVGESSFYEAEITLAAFELVGFSRNTCRNLHPARVAFLLETWYRLVQRAVSEHRGLVDRCVGDRVTTLFGFPHLLENPVQQALDAAISLHRALDEFNQAHDLQLRLRAGIAHGLVLVGHVAGDVVQTSVQGPLLGDMKALSKSKLVDAAIRLNPAAYYQVSASGRFTRFAEPLAGEAWAMHLDENELAHSAPLGIFDTAR